MKLIWIIDNIVRYIYFVLPPSRYGNQNYILYNVVCPANHNAYFELLKLNLEEPNCNVGGTDMYDLFS